ncbi:MAG: hypothetical protein WA080_01395, partial [Sulfuricurvum sp.]
MIIAKVTEVFGDVLIKKADGTSHKLSLGETIESGDVIVNSDGSASYHVRYTGHSETANFKGTAPQLFDSTMIPEHFEASESRIGTAHSNPFLTHPALHSPQLFQVDHTISLNEYKKNHVVVDDHFHDRTGGETHTNSDLREGSFSAYREVVKDTFDNRTGDQTRTGSGLKDGNFKDFHGDVFDFRTGKEMRPDSDLRGAEFDAKYKSAQEMFADRTGDQTNLSSDLRGADFSQDTDHSTPYVPPFIPPFTPSITPNETPPIISTNYAPTAVGNTLSGNANDPSIAVSLMGTDSDGSVISVTITTLPSPTQGVLYYADGLTAVTVGQVLTPAQASSLKFDPSGTYTGNSTFTFTVTDNLGA